MTEKEVKALRDKLYGPATDNNWVGCRENWLKPENTQWLVDMVTRIEQRRTEKEIK